MDQHHTVEDCGIALGQAIAKALGDKRGIVRYAHAYLPMDETLTRTALDISGRPYLIWRVSFPAKRSARWTRSFFASSFRRWRKMPGSRFTSRPLYGENSHHIAESCFKGLARALRDAIAIDEQGEGRDTIHERPARELMPKLWPPMIVYTVHEPGRPAKDRSKSGRTSVVFVKEGFTLVGLPIWSSLAAFQGACGLSLLSLCFLWAGLSCGPGSAWA